jgi:hypothetical protein
VEATSAGTLVLPLTLREVQTSSPALDQRCATAQRKDRVVVVRNA